MIDRNQPLFKSIFGKDWQRLPPVMRKQYANRPYTNDVVTLKAQVEIDSSGLMNYLFPFFRLFKILIPYKGKDIPATIYLRSDPNSCAFHFDRTFYIPNKEPYHFRSYMLPIKDNVVVEYLISKLGWRTKFGYENNKVIEKHDGYVLTIGKLVIPLPLTWVFGKVNVEQVAHSEDAFYFRLEMTHFLLGKYIYAGEFKIVQ